MASAHSTSERSAESAAELQGSHSATSFLIRGLGWPASTSSGAPGLGWPDVSRETRPEAAALSLEAARASPEAGPSQGAVDLSSEAAQVDSQAAGVAHVAAPVPPVGGRRMPVPDSTRTLVIANQKGGVGKTTTAVNIAAALAQHGLKVLLLDLDPQGNASTALSVEHGEGTPGIYDVLIAGAAISDVRVESKHVPGLYVVPATIDLAGAEIELVSMVARETRLRRALEVHLAERGAAGERYDYVLIDCPPSLGLLTVNALSAGKEMLVPIQCEYYAMEGLGQLLRTLEQIREHLNPELQVGAILLTMYDARTRLAQGVADEVRRHFGDVVLSAVIPRSVRISEAPSHGQTVVTYDPSSAGASSYVEAATELSSQSKDSA